MSPQEGNVEGELKQCLALCIYGRGPVLEGRKEKWFKDC